MRRALISIVGDGAVPEGSDKLRLAEEMGRLLVEAGHRVLTGGMGGVMQAAHRGARKADGYRPGDTVGVLPGPEADDANPFCDVAIPSGLGHARNAIVARADAVIAIGGGAGTLSEVALAWVYQRLVIGFRVDGWSGQLAGQPVDPRPRFAGITDDVVFGVDTPYEAMGVLDKRLDAYLAARRG